MTHSPAGCLAVQRIQEAPHKCHLPEPHQPQPLWRYLLSGHCYQIQGYIQFLPFSPSGRPFLCPLRRLAPTSYPHPCIFSNILDFFFSITVHVQKDQSGRSLTPHSQLHRQARLEGAPHPPIYSPLGKNFLFSLGGSQVPSHSSPGEALAPNTLPRRNYFIEVTLPILRHQSPKPRLPSALQPIQSKAI